MAKRFKGKLLEQTKLTPIQKRFCMQVSILSSISAAARFVGISDRTARRWLNLPLVVEYINELHEQSFATAMQMLENATLSAVILLNEAMNSEHTETVLKLRAAQILLDRGIEAHKVKLLDTRLAALEHQLQMNQIVLTGEVFE